MVPILSNLLLHLWYMTQKKKKKEEDVGVERGNLETHEDSQVFSPKKGQKKKNMKSNRRKRSGEARTEQGWGR